MTEDEEFEAARTLIGLVLAIERGDKGAEAALFYGGPEPLDERRLLAVACRMIYDLAGNLGEELDPPEAAEAVLQQLVLDGT